MDHQALALKDADGRAEAVVLFLHGGRESGLTRPTRWNLPGLRMLPFVHAVRSVTDGHGVATGVVRYRHCGWNGDRADAARDVRDALGEIARRCGPVPVVLVGHSMGGRAALRVADHPRVRSVIALAPWCPAKEPVEHLAGVSTVIVHSDRDRVTEPRLSRVFAARARAAGAPVCRFEIKGSDHAMLRHAARWHRLTARLATGLLGIEDLPLRVGAALRLDGGAPDGLDLDLASVAQEA
ncbi:alpha/beta fold hydrolase [Streptomyces sp. NPDC047108]|uniref:alpha/beta hydrolase n=1 Tax=Streptomyces sp. NPDC047108 TaxID=3155025 RepID=UPI0033FB29B2